MNLILLRKPAVTLLELLISTVLTIALISTLTFFYQQMSVVGIEMDKVKKEQFLIRYAETRLADIIPKILGESDPDFAFFSTEGGNLTQEGSPTLIFTFDNGVSLEKHFSNQVIGRLYVSKEGQLSVAYWPTKGHWDKQSAPPIKRELLLDGVESMKLSYFVPPKQEKKKEAAEPKEGEAEPEKKGDQQKQKEEKPENAESKSTEKSSPDVEGGWTDSPWLSDYKMLPALLKIELVMKNREQRQFVFPLANTKNHIVIRQ